MAKNHDLPYEKVTNKIIESLEQGIVPWKKPWKCVGEFAPRNVESGHIYNGVNLLITGSAMKASPYWGTFNNWAKLGGSPVAGQSYPIVFWMRVPLKDKVTGEPILDDKGREKTWGYYVYYNVWNAQDVNGIDLEKYIPKDETTGEFNPIEQAEKVLAEMPNAPKVIHGGNSASYSPTLDIVRLPSKDQFKSPAEYYCTAFHENGHSTGHPSRVGRVLNTDFGSDPYSFEELVAEITACFLCSYTGIEQTFENSASYIKGWLQKLKGDKKFIVNASKDARYATEYILGKPKTEYKTKAKKEMAEA